MTANQESLEQAIEKHVISREPYYLPAGKEVELFETAYNAKLPVLLKGPTGCGKTRFIEYMAWRLGRPLVTVACHEDLSATDLVGRFLLEGDETIWHDGPLTTAVKHGAICYLDEVVEARKDVGERGPQTQWLERSELNCHTHCYNANDSARFASSRLQPRKTALSINADVVLVQLAV